MKKLLLALALWPSLAWGQAGLTPTLLCNSTAIGSGVGTSQAVVPSGIKIVNICGFDVTATAAGTFQLEYGTGATCGTGTTLITAAHNIPASFGLSSSGRAYSTPQGQGLCVVAGGTGPLQWTIYYSQN